jgi:hypothetical protein
VRLDDLIPSNLLEANKSDRHRTRQRNFSTKSASDLRERRRSSTRFSRRFVVETPFGRQKESECGGESDLSVCDVVIRNLHIASLRSFVRLWRLQISPRFNFTQPGPPLRSFFFFVFALWLCARQTVFLRESHSRSVSLCPTLRSVVSLARQFLAAHNRSVVKNRTICKLISQAPP